MKDIIRRLYRLSKLERLRTAHKAVVLDMNEKVTALRQQLTDDYDNTPDILSLSYQYHHSDNKLMYDNILTMIKAQGISEFKTRKVRKGFKNIVEISFCKDVLLEDKEVKDNVH